MQSTMGAILKLKTFLFLAACTTSFSSFSNIPYKKNTLTLVQRKAMTTILANHLKNQKMPSVVAAATRGNEVIWVGSLGYADLENKIKTNPHFHMYRWASVSKVATDMMIRSQDEKGVLDMDKPISAYYPSSTPRYLKRCFRPVQLKKYFTCRQKFGSSPVKNIRGACFEVKTLGRFGTDKGYDSWVSDKTKKRGQVVYKTKEGKTKCRVGYKIKESTLGARDPIITLRNILNHTSGIQHYNHLGRSASPDSKDTRNRDAIRLRKKKKHSQMAWAIPSFFPKHPLLTRPGVTKTYTTFGYNLAGRILERVTGKRYETLLKSYVKGRGAKSVQADYLGIKSEGNFSRTFTYKRSQNKFVKNNYTSDNSYKLAGGGVMSTITDLARFCVAIGKKKVFLRNGITSYTHNGSHSSRSRSRLKLKTKGGQKQCLVVMTNTQHKGLNINTVEKDLSDKLVELGVWK